MDGDGVRKIWLLCFHSFKLIKVNIIHHRGYLQYIKLIGICGLISISVSITNIKTLYFVVYQISEKIEYKH